MRERPGEAQSQETLRRIVVLLARGRTDDQISRELALSKRTVQRRIAQLMELYGVTSRFALGFALGRRRRPPAQSAGRRDLCESRGS
ncbi:hypothetical protein ACFQLX_07720 [Streptomyces polyrhachis]|uniref:HTH luxR-type domain-containing protein n=1 Tax=Streptomyces polyrhachis TaxID=1282885 RepID=A0ABW2GFH1_9ACTN